MANISVIIPVLNEAGSILDTLDQFDQLGNKAHEIIVVDGGSVDATTELASSRATVISSPPGRAMQMNAGAQRATGDVYLFLHADTRLPATAISTIHEHISNGAEWGRFDVRLSGRNVLFRLIETMMNLRSCLTSVATGDQAIFVRAAAFEQVGQYDRIALMEDVALSKKLRRHSRAVCVKDRVVTSSRRWENYGIVKTVLLMWWLRLLYFIGMPTDVLAEKYYGER